MFHLWQHCARVRVQSLRGIQLFCDPMDCSLPVSSVHGISQAKTVEWDAIFYYRGSSKPKDQICISCIGRWILYHWARIEALRGIQSQTCVSELVETR